VKKFRFRGEDQKFEAKLLIGFASTAVRLEARVIELPRDKSESDNLLPQDGVYFYSQCPLPTKGCRERTSSSIAWAA
jgi:hypothetical protein